MKRFLIKLIRIYQRTLSPDWGLLKRFYPYGYCKYSPSCSQYCIDAIEKYGAIHGSLKGAHRIVRCNPWSRGGYDPVK